MTLAKRVADAACHLLRYSEPHSEEIVRVLELLGDVNDNLCNDRDPSCNAEALAEMRRLLDGIDRSAAA